jgi:hypothetical protein
MHVGEQDPSKYDFIAFNEVGGKRILYITFESRNALINVYPSMKEAVTKRPTLRRLAEIMGAKIIKVKGAKKPK